VRERGGVLGGRSLGITAGQFVRSEGLRSKGSRLEYMERSDASSKYPSPEIDVGIVIVAGSASKKV
jgi:hypothetical protein